MRNLAQHHGKHSGEENNSDRINMIYHDKKKRIGKENMDGEKVS